MRPLALAEDGWSVMVLDQTRLPHEETWVRLTAVSEVARAITTMQVRGAPLIGVAAAYGLCLALRTDPTDNGVEAAARQLLAARPTAVNLAWAVETIRREVLPKPPGARVALAYAAAAALAEREVAACRAIGDHGLPLLERMPHRPVQVMTHCNAGWLATLEYGTALAPVYRAHEEGLSVHVWVSETRPRNQGWLTAWELNARGVPHTVVADNAAGHLLAAGQVDIVLVGSDRTTRTGDVCNKIGTRLKALAARDAGVPFYAAVPSSSIDWDLNDATAIPIEERSPEELTTATGRGEDGTVATVTVASEMSPVMNPAFDVTPAGLVTGIITERGVCPASEAGLLTLFPERAR